MNKKKCIVIILIVTSLYCKEIILLLSIYAKDINIQLKI